MWRGAFLAAQEALSHPALLRSLHTRPAGVKCVVFNDKYMTCMWGNQEDQPVANYSLYYWYGTHLYQHQPVATECRRYLQHNGINIGCWFDDSEITPFQTFRVHINASLGSRTHVIPTYDMKLQDLVKPDPPVNLTLQNMSNHQLQLSWQTPYPKPHCMEYAVRYKSNKDTDWMVHRVSGELFSFPSIDEEKKYTFHVRSKISQYCGSTQLWSEWSVPVYWGNAMAHGDPVPTAPRLPPAHPGPLGPARLTLACPRRLCWGAVLGADGPDPSGLRRGAADARRDASPHGESVDRLHAPGAQPQQDLRRALQHPQGQLPGVGWRAQGRGGELHTQLQREHLPRQRAAPQGGPGARCR
uniref:Fibronectin type-III domain-containing protein n=1 Tax=Crocodylus porosus TaxID=8502 RepID=A0A7M4E6J8_CROPO